MKERNHLNEKKIVIIKKQKLLNVAITTINLECHFSDLFKTMTKTCEYIERIALVFNMIKIVTVKYIFHLKKRQPLHLLTYLP